jgi:hypothetical protein
MGGFMGKSIGYGLVSILLLGVLACSKSDNKSGNNETPTPAAENKEVPKTASAPEIDKEISRETTLGALKERKTSLEFRDDINVGTLGNELYFQNGEILKSESQISFPGFVCKLTIRNGKTPLKADKFQITYKTESGYGTGGNGYLDFQSGIYFNPIEDAKIKDLVCSYRGSDALFSAKLSDLDKTFGTWIDVVVYK